MRKEMWIGACALLALVLLFGCAGTNGGAANGAGPGDGSAVRLENVSYASGAFVVSGLLCQPSRPNGKAVAVVLTGGDGVSLETLRPVCQAFAAQGLTALAHDDVNGSIGENVQVVGDALGYLKSRFPDMPRALWAHSAGTIFAVFAAYGQSNLTAFVDTSGHMQIPLCDRPGSAPPMGETCVAYLTDFPAPILVVHGLNDTTVPVDFAYAFANRLQAVGNPYGLIVVSGGVHEFLTDRPWVLADEVAFIRHEPYNQTN